MRNTSLSVLETHSRSFVPVHQEIARRAAQQDQLGRDHADVDRRAADWRTATCRARAFLTSSKFSSAGSAEKLGGSLPAAVHGPVTVGRRQPAVVVAQVESLGRLVLEHIPVGVDRELQIVLLDRTPDRIAVEVDDHRRRAG